MWQKASEEEKAPYIAMSNQDKNRYQAELEAYNYRQAHCSNSNCRFSAKCLFHTQAWPSQLLSAATVALIAGEVICQPLWPEDCSDHTEHMIEHTLVFVSAGFLDRT